MRYGLYILLGLLAMVAACTGTTTDAAEDGMQVIKIGAITPLTGDGAVYGLPVQRVTERAVADLNEKWAEKNMRLEVIYEDGKCTGRDALNSAQKLVNFDGVNVIYGGVCSGETLGVAPFTESQGVLLFSAVSSSPDISEAGDLVFRNYPSDTAQVRMFAEYLIEEEISTIALVSENTDYAQALRRGYVERLTRADIEIVVDEVIDSAVKDIRTQLTKVKVANPDAVIFMPQTIPSAVIYAQQAKAMGLEMRLFGNEIIAMEETINQASSELEGYIFPKPFFEKESEPAVQQMLADTGCDIGVYCATTYDGIMLLGELMETCGDDAMCLRDALYATQEWEGEFSGSTSFDEKGDVQGSFLIMQVVDGETVPLE